MRLLLLFALISGMSALMLSHIDGRLTHCRRASPHVTMISDDGDALARAVAAEEAAEELRAELAALRTLYADEVAHVDDLMAQVERDSDGGAGSTADTSAADSEQIAKLTADRDWERARADAAEADLADATAEVEAVKMLSAEDASFHNAEVQELTERVLRAEAAMATAADGDGGEAAQQTIRELRQQVADLLAALEATEQGAVAELMQLRPKYEALKAEAEAGRQAPIQEAAAADSEAP